MSPKGDPKCDGVDQGVDLNRNWFTSWEMNKGLVDPCAEFNAGTEPFSEPETRALRDFLEAKKGEIKFVLNFHSNGNSFVWAFNAKNPNDIQVRAPGVL